MNEITLNPQFATWFGTFGQESLRKMNKTLTAHSLGLTFNYNTKKFTVLRSASLSRQDIEQIFAKKSYRGWAPKVLEETDTTGNRLVQFRAIIERSYFAPARPFSEIRYIGFPMAPSLQTLPPSLQTRVVGRITLPPAT